MPIPHRNIASALVIASLVAFVVSVVVSLDGNPTAPVGSLLALAGSLVYLGSST